MRKFDVIFASLLQGEDAETGAVLPGFERGRDRVVSTTEKVRIKSIAESMRITVLDVLDRDGGSMDEEEDEEDGDVDDDDYDDIVSGGGDVVGRWEMEAARVFEKTIQLLGDEFGQQQQQQGTL